MRHGLYGFLFLFLLAFTVTLERCPARWVDFQYVRVALRRMLCVSIQYRSYRIRVHVPYTNTTLFDNIPFPGKRIPVWYTHTQQKQKWWHCTFIHVQIVLLKTSIKPYCVIIVFGVVLLRFTI